MVLGGSGGGGTWWWSLIARVSWGSQGCLVSGIFVGWHLVGGVDAKKGVQEVKVLSKFELEFLQLQPNPFIRLIGPCPLLHL